MSGVGLSIVLNRPDKSIDFRPDNKILCGNWLNGDDMVAFQWFSKSSSSQASVLQTVLSVEKVIMLNQIEGIDEIQALELRQQERAKEFAKFIDERAEILREVRDNYRFLSFSVDFGDQLVELEYTDARFMRCADSDGQVYFERTIPEEIPSSELVRIVDSLFQREPLTYLCEILELDWTELSYLVSPSEGSNVKDRPPRNLREFLGECLEWAVLLDYARNNPKTILLKDGLLRNKIFKREASNPDCAYFRLKNRMEEICRDNNCLIIGIAKSSQLRRQVNLFVKSTQMFKRPKPFVIRVENEHELMRQSYKYQLYREGEVVFGNHLYLMRFKPTIKADIFTIEIPEFAETDWDGVPRSRKSDYAGRSYAYIASLIAGLPLRTLPNRFNGAPEPLARAHEHARTKLMEARGIERLIKQNIREQE